MNSYIKYGLYLAAASVAFSLLSYGLGLDMKPIGQQLNYVFYLIILIVIIMGVKFRREKELGGFISFGGAFKFGMGVTLVGSVITALYTFIYVKFLNPGIRGYIMDLQEQKMFDQGLPEDQIKMSLNMMEKFMSPIGMTMFGFVGSIIAGLIISLIVAAVMKKENPNATTHAADVLDS